MPDVASVPASLRSASTARTGGQEPTMAITGWTNMLDLLAALSVPVLALLLAVALLLRQLKAVQ